jgi:hypothetical protein
VSSRLECDRMPSEFKSAANTLERMEERNDRPQ